MLIISMVFTVLGLFILQSNNAMSINNIYRGLYHFHEVILFLITVSALKILIKNIGSLINRDVNRDSIPTYTIISCLTFGLATPVLIKNLLGKYLDDTTNSTRLVCVSMFIFPTTVASSFLYDQIHPNLIISFIFSLLVLPVVFIIFRTKIIFNKISLYLLLMSFVSVLFILSVKNVFEISLLLSQTIFYLLLSTILILFLLSKTRIVFNYQGFIKESVSNIVFFSSMGIFSISVLTFHSVDFKSAFFGILFLLVFFPLITMFFVHPLALYAIFGLSINHCVSSVFTKEQLYILWILVFIISQLCSPSSIASIMAAQQENKSVISVSFNRHLLFCIKLSLIIGIYIIIWKII